MAHTWLNYIVGPKIFDIVLTFVGDSTITKGFDMFLLITLFCSYVQYLRKKYF